MDPDKLLKSLNPSERRVLPLLKQYSDFESILKKANLKEVEVHRALQWLENKEIIKLKKDIKEIISLDHNGQVYAKIGLPERRFLEVVSEESPNLLEIQDKAKLSYEEVNVCIGALKQKEAITILSGMRIRITEKGKKLLAKDTLEEQFLKKLPLELDKLSTEGKYAFTELKKRKAIIKVELIKEISVSLTPLGKSLVKRKLPTISVETLTPEMLRKGTWRGKEFRRYDVKINVPKVYPAKQHITTQAIDYIKRIWLDLGFKEMTGPLIATSFWNFDALFTAQDHPARDLQDSFYIKDPEYGKLPDKELVEKVKKTHENGWTTKSTGWQYAWNMEEARRNVLRTHTTILSAKTIASLKQTELPAKYFSVAKCFRNETLDWSHLFEFYQAEGIVIDENVNFKHLLGYLKEFFLKMGFSKIRFRPSFFPYTEISIECEVFHPIKKQWVELGGAGIFRPEVVKPLFGKDVPVLAWGLGLDRVILDYYEFKDIRELYKNDLKQLKEAKVWLK